MGKKFEREKLIKQKIFETFKREKHYKMKKFLLIKILKEIKKISFYIWKSFQDGERKNFYREILKEKAWKIVEKNMKNLFEIKKVIEWEKFWR